MSLFFLRSLVLAFVFFFFVPSHSASNLTCRSLFGTSRSFTVVIDELLDQASQAQRFEIQELLKSRNLPEAARLADQFGLANLSYGINKALRIILLTDTVKREIEIEDGGSEVFLVEFESGVKAIFKPEYRYWKNSHKIEYGKYLSNPSAEVGAYRLARIWGLDFVPMTLMRTLNGKTGSLQAFVKRGFEPNEESLDYQINLHNLAVFDFLIRNADRSYGYNAEIVDLLNIIFSGKTIWAIDHGASFQPNLKTMVPSIPLKHINLKYLSLSYIQNLKATTPNIIREILKSYPNQTVVEEIIERRNQLIKELPPQPASQH